MTKNYKSIGQKKAIKHSSTQGNPNSMSVMSRLQTLQKTKKEISVFLKKREYF